MATDAPTPQQRHGFGIQGACRNLAKTEPGLVFYEAFVDHRQPAQDLLEPCRLVHFAPLSPLSIIPPHAGASSIPSIG
jgi:hypothetical protein